MWYDRDMLTLRQVLAEAEKRGTAVGHFNASNIEMLTGIIRASRTLNVPVIIGFSEGERDFFGVRQAVEYVRSVREETGHPIFSNADHTYSLERVKEAIDVGFDSVIYDGADKSYEENRDTAKAAVAYARASGKEVLIEAELGFIGSGSQIIDAPPDGAVITVEHMTKPEEAAQFVQETGVDLLAPAVGNLHGLLKGGSNPHINLERVRAIREAAHIPLVLHGGSGIADENLQAGIAAGIAQVHVSTELRVAYRDALHRVVSENKHDLAPYKLMAPVVHAVEEVVEHHLKLFSV
jgi:fructose-bisphosphate aldolase class II